MLNEKLVGGLLCSDVLALLPDFVAGELDTRRLDRIKLHLEGCDTCERFGGEYAEAVQTIKRMLTSPVSAAGLRKRVLETVEQEQASRGE